MLTTGGTGSRGPSARGRRRSRAPRGPRFLPGESSRSAGTGRSRSAARPACTSRSKMRRSERTRRPLRIARRHPQRPSRRRPWPLPRTSSGGRASRSSRRCSLRIRGRRWRQPRLRLSARCSSSARRRSSGNRRSRRPWRRLGQLLRQEQEATPWATVLPCRPRRQRAWRRRACRPRLAWRCRRSSSPVRPAAGPTSRRRPRRHSRSWRRSTLCSSTPRRSRRRRWPCSSSARSSTAPRESASSGSRPSESGTPPHWPSARLPSARPPRPRPRRRLSSVPSSARATYSRATATSCPARPQAGNISTLSRTFRARSPCLRCSSGTRWGTSARTCQCGAILEISSCPSRTSSRIR
mmetsp:Transcript_42900/g.127149  ORF Transcript_42900/g.127149 Transcript_42900/m.127149 type:complete len:353 (+) Transcript_42900:1720-2778(+)